MLEIEAIKPAESLEEILDKGKENIERPQATQKKQYDKAVKEITFKVDDLVLLSNSRQRVGENRMQKYFARSVEAGSSNIDEQLIDKRLIAAKLATIRILRAKVELPGESVYFSLDDGSNAASSSDEQAGLTRNENESILNDSVTETVKTLFSTEQQQQEKQQQQPKEHRQQHQQEQQQHQQELEEE
ncbi:unnamed protein product [Brachionus calyciflorus]|uniref:Uncharacterized protein n=1 Tax=Brachionus calyciflorus TaxID=104777 RepID=A0A814FL67_9BILA|nr:unnamed protein product [Brachionus calyciflorus]